MPSIATVIRASTLRRNQPTTAPASSPVRVVILGGGYTGVWAARRLRRQLNSGRPVRSLLASLPGLRGRSSADSSTQLTLISASQNHSFHGWTAEVITGHVRLEHTLTPLTQLLPMVQVRPGRVVGVNLDDHTVALEDAHGTTFLEWDQLVLGVGSQDAFDSVPGLASYGFTTKGNGRLADLTNHLQRVIAKAAASEDIAERRQLLTVLVVGGGFAGVETAVAIRQRLGALAAQLPVLAGIAPRVILAHSGPYLLPSLRPEFKNVAEHADAQVRSAGVEIWCQTRVTAVTAEEVRFDSRDPLATATVVSALGQRPVPLPGTESLLRDDGGRVVVNLALQVQTAAGSVAGVWAGGDQAAVPLPRGGGYCPASALWAIYQGQRIGSNIGRTIRGNPARPFRFPGLGQAASFGVGLAAAELCGIPLLGWPGWLARWVLFHYFMPSRRVAVRTIWEWFRKPARSQISG